MDSEQTNSALGLGVSINRDCSVKSAGGFLVQVGLLHRFLALFIYVACQGSYYGNRQSKGTSKLTEATARLIVAWLP